MSRFFFYITLFFVITFTGFNADARVMHISGQASKFPHISGSVFGGRSTNAPEFTPQMQSMPLLLPRTKFRRLPEQKQISRPKQKIKAQKINPIDRQKILSHGQKPLERRERIKIGWKSFTRLNTKHWVVAWNSRTGLPYKILGNKSHAFSGNVQEVALEFLNENKDLFLLRDDLSDLTIKEQSESAGKSIITFYQTYNSIPVFNSEISIYTTNIESKAKKTKVLPYLRTPKKTKEAPPAESKKSVFMVVCTLYPLDENKIGQYNIGRTHALNIAKEAFERRGEKAKVFKTEKVIYHTREEVYMAWKVLFGEEKVKQRFFVDASSGVILLRDSTQ